VETWAEVTDVKLSFVTFREPSASKTTPLGLISTWLLRFRPRQQVEARPNAPGSAHWTFTTPGTGQDGRSCSSPSEPAEGSAAACSVGPMSLPLAGRLLRDAPVIGLA
jgi:hypothetical protein